MRDAIELDSSLGIDFFFSHFNYNIQERCWVLSNSFLFPQIKYMYVYTLKSFVICPRQYSVSKPKSSGNYASLMRAAWAKGRPPWGCSTCPHVIAFLDVGFTYWSGLRIDCLVCPVKSTMSWKDEGRLQSEEKDADICILWSEGPARPAFSDLFPPLKFLSLCLMISALGFCHLNWGTTYTRALL